MLPQHGVIAPLSVGWLRSSLRFMAAWRWPRAPLKPAACATAPQTVPGTVT